MARVIAERTLERSGWDAAEIRSAGVSAASGSMASDGAIQAAADHGLDLDDHRSSPLSEELVEWADLILTMGVHHLLAVEDKGGRGKTAMLSAFAEGRESVEGWGIPDPFAGDLEVYRESFRVLEELVEASVARLDGDYGTITGNDS